VKVPLLNFDVFFVSDRHPSGVFSYGNSSITLKVMERDGTFLPGEIYKDLGYVSSLYRVIVGLILHSLYL